MKSIFFLALFSVTTQAQIAQVRYAENSANYISGPQVHFKGEWLDLDITSNCQALCRMFGYSTGKFMFADAPGCSTEKLAIVNERGEVVGVKPVKCGERTTSVLVQIKCK